MPLFITKNLADALTSGEYVNDSIKVKGFNYPIVVEPGGDALEASVKFADHYRCPGCKHWRPDFALVDCRGISDASLQGQRWFCDGCHTYMVFEAGKAPSLYEKLAVDVKGLGGSFRNRRDFIKERVRRKGRVNKAIDDVTDALTDAMEIAPTIDEIAMIRDAGIAARINPYSAKDYLLQRKGYDGILITKRTERNMPMSLWLELHNAPASFVNKFKGLPGDFQP